MPATPVYSTLTTPETMSPLFPASNYSNTPPVDYETFSTYYNTLPATVYDEADYNTKSFISNYNQPTVNTPLGYPTRPLASYSPVHYSSAPSSTHFTDLSGSTPYSVNKPIYYKHVIGNNDKYSSAYYQGILDQVCLASNERDSGSNQGTIGLNGSNERF
jgi:hypothetical protein